MGVRWHTHGALGCALLVVALVGCNTRQTPRFSPPAPTGNGANPPRGGTVPGVTPGTPPDQPSVPAGNGQPTGPTPGLPTLPTNPTASSAPTAPTNSGGGSGGASLPGLTTVQLGGFLSFPARVVSNNGSGIIANNGSGIIANNGSGILANNGGGILSDQGGGILSDQGGGILSDQGGGYRLAEAAGPDRGLVNAFMYLTDRDERFFVRRSNGKVFTATSGADGAYDFGAVADEGFPLGKEAVVNALLPGNLRLVGFTVPVAGTQSVKVNLGTTVASELLRGEAYRLGRSMNSYDLAAFRGLVDQTNDAIATGTINAVEVKPDGRGSNVVVNNFDLRLDQTQNLRNQYVVSFTVADVANATLKAISDGWKALFGERPAAVTSLVGSGEAPTVDKDYNTFNFVGFATGDDRGGTPVARNRIPLGFNHGLAVSARGDVFISCFTQTGNSGHIRWIKPDGTITSIWQPTFSLAIPLGLAIEKQPTDNPNDPGVLLVTDIGAHAVYRVPIVDEATFHPDDPFTEAHPWGIVAGETAPIYPLDNPFYGVGSGYEFIFGGAFDKDHPEIVDGLAAPAVARTSPAVSGWRAAEEGPRRYTVGDADHAASSAVPNSARYAHLNYPRDVEVDELGNIYIADQLNHRIRFIPSANALAAEPDQNFFDYHAPIVDGSGAVVGYEPTPTTMVAGAMYTIAGGPAWDPVREPNDPRGAWFGAYELSDGQRGQLAHLDQPQDVAFFEGKLYIADFDNNRIRVLDRQSGIIQTLAGNPPEPQQGSGGDFDYPVGYTGDGGPAAQARLAHPQAIAIDASRRRLYISDTDSGRIRMVDLATGTLTSVAGRLHDGRVLDANHKGDGEARFWADLYLTRKLGVDPQGNVIFNDGQHGRVRKLWRQWE